LLADNVCEEKRMNTHVDELVMQTTRHFDNPGEVLTYPGLKHKDRLRILESWKLDAQRLTESTAENMSGGEKTNLRDVSRALMHLKSKEHPPGAKQRPDVGRPIAEGMAIGGLLGTGAGLVATAATPTVSFALVAQASVVGLIVGGIAGALRAPQQKKGIVASKGRSQTQTRGNGS
jgi:hypothetical protein